MACSYCSSRAAPLHVHSALVSQSGVILIPINDEAKVDVGNRTKWRESLDGWMNEWPDGLVGWLDGWMDGWTVETQTYNLHQSQNGNNFLACRAYYGREERSCKKLNGGRMKQNGNQNINLDQTGSSEPNWLVLGYVRQSGSEIAINLHPRNE